MRATAGMSSITKDRIIAGLYEVLKEFASEGHPKETCQKLLKGMQTRGMNQEEIIRTLTCAIADGVLYGNWPWSKKL